MRDTCWSNLVLLEINAYPLAHIQLVQVVLDGLVGFSLVELPSFLVKVFALSPIFLKETVQNFPGGFQILAVWLFKLFEELLSPLRIFVLKLRVDFAVAFEEPFLALMQILGQGMLKRLQFECIFLLLFGLFFLRLFGLLIGLRFLLVRSLEIVSLI